MNVRFYIENSYHISKLITQNYSTSFSLATSLLEKEKRRAIYAVYGFVRLADEIVDSFHDYDKAFLIDKLNDDLVYALANDISTNPVLAAFADTVKRYHIPEQYIAAFMESMRCDLSKTEYTSCEELDKYIHGSADVVGLMCLKIFCDKDQTLYSELEYSAQKLGSAFQKVNFIRDLNDDTTKLGRSYFPEVSNKQFDASTKKTIEASIDKDFEEAWIGLKRLPGRSKLAVAIAYFYYKRLFEKIKRTSADEVLKERLRISNLRKYFIIAKVGFMYKTKQI